MLPLQPHREIQSRNGIAHHQSSLIHFCIFLALVSLLTGFGPSSVCMAQEDAGIRVPQLESAAIQKRIEQIADNDNTSDDVRNDLITTYEKAIQELKDAQKNAEQVKVYEGHIEKAPEQIEELQQKIDQDEDDINVEPPADASLSELERQLREAETSLSESRNQKEQLRTEADRRAERRADIPSLLHDAQDKLNEVSDELQAYTSDNVASETQAARNTFLRARRRALESKIQMLQAERRSYDAREELHPLRIDLAAQNVQRAQRRVEQWQKAVSQRRKIEGEKAVEEAQKARRQAAQKHEIIQELAADNQELASKLTGAEGLAHKIESTKRELSEVRTRKNTLQQEFTNIRDKVSTVGLTHAVGMLLLKKRSKLPGILQYKKTIKQTKDTIASVQFEIMSLEEQRSDLSVISSRVEEIMEQLPQTVDPETRDKIASEAESFLRTRRNLLDSVIRNYNTYFTNLVELDTTRRELVDTSQAYASYIDSHVIWVKSAPVLSLSALSGAYRGLRWLTQPAHWGSLSGNIWDDIEHNITLYAGFFLLLVLLTFSRPRIRQKLDDLAELVHTSQTDRVSHTPLALLLTILLAAPGPLLLIFAASRMAAPSVSTPFSNAISAGVRALAYYWFVLSFVSHTCRPNGLAKAHFRMREATLDFLKRHIHWFTVIILPAVFLTYTFQWQDNTTWTDSIGRIAYILSMGSLSVFLGRILKPGDVFVQSMLRRNREGYMYRGRYLWYGLLSLTPVVLAILSVFGYQYSAFHLATRIHLTLILIIGIMFVHYLIQRWIILVRRRLAVERVQEQRAAAEKEKTESETTPSSGTTAPEEPPEDLYSLSQQTRRILQVFLGCLFLGGLWAIWSEVMPALGILQKVTLWSVSQSTAEGVKITSITLAHLLLALVVLGLSIVAALNLPGLVEISLLQHLPLDRGVRFAITTLSRYILIIVGVVITASQFGIGWTKVQWLIAAMGVGLGFGLQEIFGNFISGLIILFERPMRVGDTVTVGDVFGTVTQIRIRATTIQQWDRKELIVPNKEFITGQLINWTLSDTILRLEFPVGIAYGSDIDLAEKTLLDIAHDTDNVLDDPPPRVIFKSFGGSALQFELRLFIPDMDHYADTWHEINRQINGRFNESDITIAFPQQDVHLDLVGNNLPDGVQPVTPDSQGD